MLFIVRRDSQLLGKLERQRLELFATTIIVETQSEMTATGQSRRLS